MKTTTLASACLLCLTLAQSLLPAQSYDFSKLDAYLQQTATRIPSGFEVMIVQDGRQLYWKTYGVWRKDEQAKIASATKWFSGALIMSLVDDGTLSLDDRASRYLPYMTGEKESITVRQLMSHTSGFGGEFPLVDPCLGDPSTTLARCAEALAKTPLRAAPGTAFIYSGAGMQVAGRVAEVASGKDWQTLFRERIAEPLGMTSTDYQYEGSTVNPRISGGGRSTATDYMKFLTMIQQRGVFEGRRVLSTRAVDTMLANQVGDATIVETPAVETWRYGIGNWLEDPDASGKTSRNSSTGLAGWTPVLDRERNLQVVVGMQNAVRPFQPFYSEFAAILRSIIPPSALTPGSITNAASYEAGPIAPGELITIFANNPGPASGVSAQIVNGELPTTLGGVQVLIDGKAAPLLYVSGTQISAAVPAEVAGKVTAEVKVNHNGSTVGVTTVPVASAWPALFTESATGTGPVSALNQDNSVNSASNPAAPGTVIQLFGTSGGAVDAANVRVTIGGQPAEVLYAGPAPGLIAAVFQINARIPSAATGAAPVVVRVGSLASLPAATIAVRGPLSGL